MNRMSMAFTSFSRHSAKTSFGVTGYSFLKWRVKFDGRPLRADQTVRGSAASPTEIVGMAAGKLLTAYRKFVLDGHEMNASHSRANAYATGLIH
jgi:hypothetical protein